MFAAVRVTLALFAIGNDGVTVNVTVFASAPSSAVLTV
jgi:hypothetical protein